MKKITLIILLISLSISINGQNVAWSSDSEDFALWSINDLDGDGNNWNPFGAGNFDTVGFTGVVFASQSWATVPLTPDNLLYTPTFLLPGTAVASTFTMRVGASFTPDFAEHYAVYVYDNAIGPSFDDKILEETLTAGGVSSSKIISVSIPSSFYGKTIGLLIRHFDCTNQEYLIVDDFEVSYSTTLSNEENKFDLTRIYPNPVKDIIKLDTEEIIDNIYIVNQIGQLILKIEREQIFKNKVNLSSLKKGLYFMTINAKNKKQIIKIIKE